MKIASITEAKNSLSALIDERDGRLSRLLRDGVVRPRRSDPSLALFRGQPPRVHAGASGVDALTRERRDER